MTKEEAIIWMKETNSSKSQWKLDSIHRTPEDSLYYLGGESGIYLRQSGQVIEIGTYEDAVPHIGEALFRFKWIGNLGSLFAARSFASEHTRISNPRAGGRA